MVEIILSYLVGSIPAGYLIAKSKGVNIRELGSGNIGATNVMRNLGKRAGLATFIFDFAKGMVPALVFSAAHIAALSAVVGHCFSIFLKGKGGKGVATAIGALLIVAPLEALLGIASFGVTYKLRKIVSLSSLTATAVTAVAYLLGSYSLEQKLSVLTIGTIIIGKHHSNIGRLLRGTET